MTTSLRRSAVSGLIGLVISVGITLILGISMTFPWSEGNVVTTVAISAFLSGFAGSLAASRNRGAAWPE